MDARRGIGLELVGIVVALVVLLVWFAISSPVNYSGPREVGTSWSNFLNWVGSSQGQIFGIILGLATLFVLLLCVMSIVSKRLDGGRPGALSHDEIEALPERPGDEQK